MHAGDGKAHDRRGQRGRHHRVGHRGVKAEADAERNEGEPRRDHDRQRDQPRVVPQQSLRLHSRHPGVMHQADAGAHQHGADRQSLEAGIGALADCVQRDAARQDARDHRQHGPDRRVGDAAGQRKGEHADEMHAPDAAAHRHRAGAGPGPSRAARIGGDDPAGDRQGDEGGQRGDDHGQRDQAGVIGAAIGGDRVDLVVDREKSPIEVQHHWLATTGGRTQSVAAFSK